nr:hypothetical transcript [Hymenolepis microstoma]
MRYSRAEYRPKYFTSSVERRLRQTLSGIHYDPVDFFRTCIPAFIYVVQNSILLFALSHLDAAIFQVTYQLKLFTTTIFSVLFLSRKLSIVHSGARTILKNSPKSLWARNFELSMASIVIAITGQMLGEWEKVAEKGFFYGFDWLVWITIGLQSIGGIIVALVVKYTDNILKGFACSASIIITCIISVFFFNATFSWTFLFGTACVVIAVVFYSAFPYKTMSKKA